MITWIVEKCSATPKRIEYVEAIFNEVKSMEKKIQFILFRLLVLIIILHAKYMKIDKLQIESTVNFINSEDEKAKPVELHYLWMPLDLRQEFNTCSQVDQLLES